MCFDHKNVSLDHFLRFIVTDDYNKERKFDSEMNSIMQSFQRLVKFFI